MRCAGNPLELKDRASRLLQRGGVLIASGPPIATAGSDELWRAVEGAWGRRLFWVAQQT